MKQISAVENIKTQVKGLGKQLILFRSPETGREKAEGQMGIILTTTTTYHFMG